MTALKKSEKALTGEGRSSKGLKVTKVQKTLMKAMKTSRKLAKKVQATRSQLGKQLRSLSAVTDLLNELHQVDG